MSVEEEGQISICLRRWWDCGEYFITFINSKYYYGSYKKAGEKLVWVYYNKKEAFAKYFWSPASDLIGSSKNVFYWEVF